MTNRARFELSLEKLDNSKWKRFEEFASAFLTNRPEEDIGDYLRENANILVVNLEDSANKASTDLRQATKEIWTQIHDARRSKNDSNFEPTLSIRLAEHDTENYLGTIGHRSQEVDSAFGYTCWWLTLDHMAFEIKKKLDERLGYRTPPSPVMSADFLLNYLSFGPIRGVAAKHADGGLPVAIDPALVEYMTPEILAAANAAREASKGLPEHVIRRKVRDALDQARRRVGEATAIGVKSISTALAADQS